MPVIFVLGLLSLPPSAALNLLNETLEHTEQKDGNILAYSASYFSFFFILCNLLDEYIIFQGVGLSQLSPEQIEKLKQETPCKFLNKKF